MVSFVWPIALVVFSNTLYQICAKEVPGGVNAFATLTVTYLVGALASGVLFFVTGNGASLLQEYGFRHRQRRQPFAGVRQTELGVFPVGPGYCGTGSRLDLRL